MDQAAPENEARKDLDQIRAAGGVGATREEGLKIMEAEARQIKILAECQSECSRPSSEWRLRKLLMTEITKMNGVITLSRNG